jgi:hypothetical protein
MWFLGFTRELLKLLRNIRATGCKSDFAGVFIGEVSSSIPLRGLMLLQKRNVIRVSTEGMCYEIVIYLAPCF